MPQAPRIQARLFAHAFPSMTKIGFFSDVHGNLEALTAILKRLDQLSCDLLVCLGDIVGYGANPSECIQIIR